MSLRAIWALARAEAIELLRTPEVHAYLVVPALVLLPLVALLVSLIVAFSDTEVGVIPADFPAQLPGSGVSVEEDLLEEDWVLRRGDPLEMLASGEAEAGVTSWRETPTGLAIEVGGADADDLADDFEDAAQRAVEAHIREIGADPDEVWTVARIEDAGGDRKDLDIPRGVIIAYLLFLCTAIGYTLLPAALAADRQRGVLEALVATPAPRWALLTVRVALISGLQLLTLALHYLNVYGLFSSLFDIALLPPLDAVLSVLTALLFFNTIFGLAGLAATNARQAYYLAAPAWAGGTVALVVGFATDASGSMTIEPWVPIVGLVTAGNSAEGWVAVASSGLVTAVVLAVFGGRWPVRWALPGRDA